jgi:hypothetical protein
MSEDEFKKYNESGTNPQTARQSGHRYTMRKRNYGHKRIPYANHVHKFATLEVVIDAMKSECCNNKCLGNLTPNEILAERNKFLACKSKEERHTYLRNKMTREPSHSHVIYHFGTRIVCLEAFMIIYACSRKLINSIHKELVTGSITPQHLPKNHSINMTEVALGWLEYWLAHNALATKNPDNSYRLSGQINWSRLYTQMQNQYEQKSDLGECPSLSTFRSAVHELCCVQHRIHVEDKGDHAVCDICSDLLKKKVDAQSSTVAEYNIEQEIREHVDLYTAERSFLEAHIHEAITTPNISSLIMVDQTKKHRLPNIPPMTHLCNFFFFFFFFF